MAARHSRIALVGISALISGCAPDRNPVAPVRSATTLFDVHGSSAPCIDGAVGVFVSAYPNTFGAGVRSSFYASVSSADGGTLPSNSVQWSIADTTIATIGGPDENGRYFGVAKSSGTTQVIGQCGTLRATATITVTGMGTTTPDPAKVTVALSSPSLQPGQSTQAAARTVDASGQATDVKSAVWSSSNTSVASVDQSGIVTAVASGSANITASVSGATGSAALSVSGGTSPQQPDPTPPSGVAAADPALPRSVPSPDVPAPTGKTIRVAAGQDLQAALNSALPGDVVALASGATFIGNFILPAKACTGWVTVRTDVPDSDLPAAGQRITPTYAGKLAKIMTDNNQPALRAAMPTCQWRLFGVEVAVHPSFTGLQYWLMALGDGGWSGGGEQQTSLDKVPTNIVLDRMYIHGQTTSNLIRCLALNSAQTSVVNSYIDQCHGRGFDSQAIEGWNGPGPYLIENNFLAGAGENVMFGGADPGIYGLSPSDITIRRNHVYKDPTWKGLWTVKNLFELKNARRLLIEGNIFENNWADAQAGMAIVIKSSHDACTTCTWQGTQDVTFRYNIVRNSPRGLNLQAVDGESDFHVARVRAEHNLFQNIGTFLGTGSDGWLTLLTHDLKDVTLTHNTFVHSASVSGFGVLAMMDYSNGNARNIVIRNNVFTNPATYSVMYSGAQVGTKSLDAFAGSTWAFDRNVSIGVAQDLLPWHPTTSFYPSTVDAVGFVNFSGGDYRLGSSSPYKGKATDGTDPGADLDRVSQLTANVIR